MVPQVGEDLQLGHQRLLLRGVGVGCNETAVQWRAPVRRGHAPDWLHLRLSIFTATVVTVWAEQRPYAVARTTFPKAPEPRVLPADHMHPVTPVGPTEADP